MTYHLPDMELDLDAWLDRDDAGRPSFLRLEDPFTVSVRGAGGSHQVEIAAFDLHRPPAEALDILGRMSAQPEDAFKHMRAFIARIVRVPDRTDIPVDANMLGRNLSAPDFYRAWAAASDFLPRQKGSAAPS